MFTWSSAIQGELEEIRRNGTSIRINITLQTLRYTRSKGYVAVSINLFSETNDLSLSEIVYTRIISVVHEVVDG